MDRSYSQRTQAERKEQFLTRWTQDQGTLTRLETELAK